MSDYIVRATAADDAIRGFAITSREMVEQAKNNHNTSPVVTAALGRMLSAAAMMGVMMKGEDDMLTLQIQGSGPMKGITVTADSKGNVKGFPNVAAASPFLAFTLPSPCFTNCMVTNANAINTNAYGKNVPYPT